MGEKEYAVGDMVRLAEISRAFNKAFVGREDWSIGHLVNQLEALSTLDDWEVVAVLSDNLVSVLGLLEETMGALDRVCGSPEGTSKQSLLKVYENV